MIPSDENLYLQRIRRISHALAHVCPLLMITLPLAVAGYWLMADG